MKIFYLKNCPHCKRAMKWIDDLYKENPLYKTIDIEWIEEREQAALADQYDYYYVPSVYVDEQKVHEGVASLDVLRGIFNKILEEK